MLPRRSPKLSDSFSFLLSLSGGSGCFLTSLGILPIPAVMVLGGIGTTTGFCTEVSFFCSDSSFNFLATSLILSFSSSSTESLESSFFLYPSLAFSFFSFSAWAFFFSFSLSCSLAFSLSWSLFLAFSFSLALSFSSPFDSFSCPLAFLASLSCRLLSISIFFFLIESSSSSELSISSFFF